MADAASPAQRFARAVSDTWRALHADQRVAGVGAVLLIVSTFGPFSFVEGAIVLIGLAILLLLRRRAQGRDFQLPFGDGAMIAAAGAWSALLIVLRLFSRPLGQGLLALVCAAVLVAAGLRERSRVAGDSRVRPDRRVRSRERRRRGRSGAPDLFGSEPPQWEGTDPSAAGPPTWRRPSAIPADPPIATRADLGGGDPYAAAPPGAAGDDATSKLPGPSGGDPSTSKAGANDATSKLPGAGGDEPATSKLPGPSGDEPSTAELPSRADRFASNPSDEPTLTRPEPLFDPDEGGRSVPPTTRIARERPDDGR